MNFRIAALCGALALVLSACPNGGNGDGGTDAGDDGGITTPIGGCSGGCGPTQVCDEAQRVCVDGCRGGCAVGQLCVKQGEDFTCVTPETSCSGTACGAGQNTCVSGNCSCLPFTQAARDTCAEQGRVCHQPYNAGTMSGGECEDPKLYEYCRTNCPNGDCGTCAAGTGCDDRLFGDFGVCAHLCGGQAACGPDELCYGLPPNGETGFCYPKSLFGPDFDCKAPRGLADGGTETVVTFASQECLIIGEDGQPTETTPTGTCTWTFFRGDTQSFAFTYCRSPGPVPLYGACSTEPTPLNVQNTCASGLECAPTGSGTSGICLPICNAKLTVTGEPTQPACTTGNACVNIYRFENDDSVVGVCMEECNVFSTEANYGCSATGSTPTSCVPTSAQGVQVVTGSGRGVCIPQLPNAAAEGEVCASTDPLKGAACQSGLICARIGEEAQPRCVKPCDVECIPGDGGTPARCATEANATCGSNTTCTRVNGTTGAILGYCL